MYQGGKDADGDFIRAASAGRGFSGTWGSGCITAGGKYLASDPVRGLEAWNALPESERRPGAITIGERGSIDPRTAQPKPPAGGLILKAYLRCLTRDGQEIRLARQADFPHGNGRVNLNAQPNYLWLTAAEWKSLIPDAPMKGDKAAVPAAITHRIVAGYLHPVLLHCACSPWSSEKIRAVELALTVEDSSADRVRLRLDGSARLGDAYDPGRGDDLKGPFGFEPRVLGYLDYDVKKKAVARFEFIAVGDTWGFPNTDDLSWKPGWRAGRQPIGMSFERVSGENPLDRIPARMLPPGTETAR